MHWIFSCCSITSTPVLSFQFLFLPHLLWRFLVVFNKKPFAFQLQFRWDFILKTGKQNIMEKSSWEKEGQLHVSPLAANTELTQTDWTNSSFVANHPTARLFSVILCSVQLPGPSFCTGKSSCTFNKKSKKNILLLLGKETTSYGSISRCVYIKWSAQYSLFLNKTRHWSCFK